MTIFLILAFSLLLVAKTGTSGLINLGDSLFPFFPQERLQRLLYLWNSHNILGRDSSATVSQIPWYGLAALLERLGAPLWLINRLWFASPFLLLGLSMYFLSGIIFGREKKTSRLIATLFFMFNPFTLNLMGGSNVLTLSFASGVFVFGLFVYGLDKPKVDFKNVFLFGLASVFVPANLVVWAIIILLCLAYFLFFILVNRRNRSRLQHALKFSLLTIPYTLLINLWWLLPFVYQFLNPGYFGTLFASGTDVGTFEFISQFTSLFNVSRLFYGMTPTANFPISHYYHYLLAPTMMAVLAVLVFVVSLFKKKSKFEIFFLVLALFSVILASGTRPPFGFVYQFLWDHIPYFHIFRTTNRFNLYTMISYAVLLGFFYQHIKGPALKTQLERGSEKRFYKFFVGSFLTISILLSAWPLLSGDIYGQLQPHQIPQDYYDLREFLQNQKGDFRVMNFPLTTWLVPYSWSAPFDMQEILIDFSPKDVIVNLPGYLQDLEERELSTDDPLYATVYKYPESPEALDTLRQMGVRYLVVHHDYVIVHGEYIPVDFSEITSTLQKAEGVRFVRAFGDLDVYEVENSLPRVYATSGEMVYRKVSPVEYWVNIKSATEPFTLVLAENFHPCWESSVGEHVEFEGFANGWEIDKTGDYDSPEDYTIVLEYRPQRLFDIGLLVSILSLTGGLVYCVVAHFSERRKNDF